jgi:hypothetical protein
MNERIQKLIEQATSTQGPTPYNPLTFEVFDKEKFAQLIVAECISTLEEKIYRSIDHEGDEIWIDLILKEHFGVEQ